MKYYGTKGVLGNKTKKKLELTISESFFLQYTGVLFFRMDMMYTIVKSPKYPNFHQNSITIVMILHFENYEYF